MEDFGKMSSLLKSKKTFSDDSLINPSKTEEEDMFERNMKVAKRAGPVMRKTTMAAPSSTKNSPLKSFTNFENQPKPKTEK